MSKETHKRNNANFNCISRLSESVLLKITFQIPLLSFFGRQLSLSFESISRVSDIARFIHPCPKLLQLMLFHISLAYRCNLCKGVFALDLDYSPSATWAPDAEHCTYRGGTPQCVFR
jgi:hypothetical protein